jgi:hypothetical protein
VEIDLGSPVRPRRITAAFDGSQGAALGPALLLRAAPIPFGMPTGCALLMPQPSPTAAAFQLSVVTTPGTGRIASLSWVLSSRKLSLVYAYASPGDSLPSSVSESVDGVQRLEVKFTSVTPARFDAGEFAAPAGGAL